MKSINFWLDALQLEKHPEGGYFKETFRSTEKTNNLPERYSGARNFYTVIYYLLPGNYFSAFHKISSDESWFFHDGCSLGIYILKDSGIIKINLGPDYEMGERWQYMVPGNHWFAAKPSNDNSYSLVSCMVAPGFDYSDFVLGNRKELIKEYPNQKKIIEIFTR